MVSPLPGELMAGWRQIKESLIVPEISKLSSRSTPLPKLAFLISVLFPFFTYNHQFVLLIIG
jgi:hypothetical protein